MRAAGCIRDASCWIPSGLNLLGFAGKGFVQQCTAESRRDASRWVSSGCELLGSPRKVLPRVALMGFIGVRAAGFSRMQAAAFRRNVRFWVSYNDALVGSARKWAAGCRLGASPYVSSGCDLLVFVGTLAAGFRWGASCWAIWFCRMQAAGSRREEFRQAAHR